MNYTGSKFQSLGDNKYNMAFVAKLIRNDIKEAKAKGDLPKALKVSVRKDHHKTLSISLNLPGENINPGWVAAVKLDTQPSNVRFDKTATMKAVIRTVEAIANAYNYDRSNSMEDYFNTNFYLDVKIDYDAYQTDREAWLNDNADLIADLRIAHKAAPMDFLSMIRALDRSK